MLFYALFILTFIDTFSAETGPKISIQREQLTVENIEYNLGSEVKPYKGNVNTFSAFDGSTNKILAVLNIPFETPDKRSRHDLIILPRPRALYNITLDLIVDKKVHILHSTVEKSFQWKSACYSDRDCDVFDDKGELKPLVIDERNGQKLIILKMLVQEKNTYEHALCIQNKEQNEITKIYSFKYNNYPFEKVGEVYSKDTPTKPEQDNNWIYDPATGKILSYYKFFNHVVPCPNVEIITIHGFGE